MEEEKNIPEKTPKNTPIYLWEDGVMKVYDNRYNVTYLLEEKSDEETRSARKVALKLPNDLKGAPKFDMDLYIDKLIAISCIEPKLTDVDVPKLKGSSYNKLKKAVIEIYNLHDDIDIVGNL